MEKTVFVKYLEKMEKSIRELNKAGSNGGFTLYKKEVNK